MPSTNKNKNIESYHNKQVEPVEKSFDPNTMNPKVLELLKLVEERGLVKAFDKLDDDTYTIKDSPNGFDVLIENKSDYYISFKIGGHSVYELLTRALEYNHVNNVLDKALRKAAAEEKAKVNKNIERRISMYLHRVNNPTTN
jgi:hypothetical protein